MNVSIHPSWKSLLDNEFQKKYFLELTSFVKQEYSSSVVYPPARLIFNAFNLTPFNKVKVVILGQDPYHGPKQAHGLAFSVPDGLNPPPSLQNIFQELKNDLNINPPKSPDLTRWAKQGVFLLNSVLTVRAGKPGSHANKGWEVYTNNVIEILSTEKTNLVFLLWGNYARAKKTLIDKDRHLILEAPHPSPYSADMGFFGCRHFSKTNAYLKSRNIKEVLW